MAGNNKYNKVDCLDLPLVSNFSLILQLLQFTNYLKTPLYLVV